MSARLRDRIETILTPFTRVTFPIRFHPSRTEVFLFCFVSASPLPQVTADRRYIKRFGSKAEEKQQSHRRVVVKRTVLYRIREQSNYILLPCTPVLFLLLLLFFLSYFVRVFLFPISHSVMERTRSDTIYQRIPYAACAVFKRSLPYFVYISRRMSYFFKYIRIYVFFLFFFLCTIHRLTPNRKCTTIVCVRACDRNCGES